MPAALSLTLLLALQAPTARVDLLVDGGTVVTMDSEGRLLEGGAVALGDRLLQGPWSAPGERFGSCQLGS